MLYHVSFSAIRGGLFSPRVPSQRASGENDTIKRICFSDSLEKCFTALPGGGRALNNLLYFSDMLDIRPILHVYYISEEDPQINPLNLLTSSQIAGFARDAEYNNEMWVVNQTVKCAHMVIEVIHADIEECRDCNGDIVFEVSELRWKPLKYRPNKSPERRFKPFDIDIRMLLTYLDDLVNKKSA